MNKTEKEKKNGLQAWIRSEFAISTLLGIVLLITLFMLSQINFLLFHSLTEFFSIGIMWAIFILVWNTRSVIDNRSVLFLGIAFLFIGLVDTLHVLSYKGMGVFPENAPNLATQFWIVGRYLQSITFFAAPLLLNRQFKPFFVVLVFTGVTTLLIAAVFGGIFPDCFLQGSGLTAFKISSEYIISIVLAAAMWQFYRRREWFEPQILRFILLSIVASILSELFFTFYISVYGLSNVLGHGLKIIAMFFLYNALIGNAIKDPFNLIFRKLKAREQALQVSEERFSRMFREHNATMFLIEPDTGEIIDANSAAVRFYGYTQEQLCQMTIQQINTLPVKDIALLRKKAIQEKKNYFIFPHRLASGEIREVEVHSSTIISQEKKILFSIIHDITDRKKANEEKLKLENRLQQAQKMEAIGTLAGGIAHDFNNILGAIIGYTEMARDDSPKESSVVKDLDKVLEASDRAVSLVKQILAFSRQGDAEHILLSPADIVKKTITMLRPTLPTTIEITQDIDPGTGLIFADPTQIHQILMNLSTNAFHAMEETGGKLDISLKETILRDKDLANEPGAKAGTFVQLSICDSGAGIAPGIREKIFDPYFTTKEMGKGTGMGLAIIHGIVKSYGGFITLYSVLGEGSAFHVFLPVIEKDALPEIETVEQFVGGKERVLFIDDEEILADMGKDMLQRLGYHVTVRKSSLEALETFQNLPDQFDIVITDQTMPGMTGVDLARRMLQIRPDIPIILCTGYSSIISEREAKSMGIKEFALKPLTKKNIAGIIRKVLDT